MISQEDWRKLKVDEIYGMYATLAKRIEVQQSIIDDLSLRYDLLGPILKEVAQGILDHERRLDQTRCIVIQLNDKLEQEVRRK